MTSWGTTARTPRPRGGPTTALIGLLAAGALLAGVAPAGAGQPAETAPPPLAEECRVEQLTSTSTGIRYLDLTDDGERVAFISTSDLVGANPDRGPEVFDVAVNTGQVRQRTNLTGTSHMRRVSVSADGNTVAYLSDRPAPGNGEGLVELFLHHLDTGVVEQVTDGGAGNGARFEVDDAGDRLAFVTELDLDGSNPDGSTEAWLFESGVGSMPVSAQGPGSSGPGEIAISGDGEVVAYTAARDETGGNPDEGAEAFAYRPSTDTRAQVTDLDEGGASAVNDVALDQDGNTVAVSSRVPLDGSDPTGAAVQAYVSVAEPFVGEFTQIDEQSGGEAATLHPTVADAGTRVAWWADFHDLASHPVVLHDTETAESRVLLEDVGTEVVATSGSGNRVAFATRGNPLGTNPDLTDEVYVADCRTFRDVGAHHPFSADVEWLAAEGIAQGYPDDGFHPASVVSRQAAAAFLHRLAGSPEVEAPAEPTFDDVPADHPFFTEIEWAAAEGITGGYADGGFHPAADVTRQAFAAFLHRLAGSPEVEVPDPPTFSDVPAEHPFVTEIEWAADAGITGGYADGGFHPAADVTRQATAAFLHRFADNVGVPT